MHLNLLFCCRFNRNDLVIEALLAMENVILISPLAVNQEAENISVEWLKIPD
jgi:acetylglutamate kinase